MAVGRAQERLLLRSGEDRSRDRVVGESEARRGPSSPVAVAVDHELALTERQVGDDALQATAAGRILDEGVGHILAVQLDGHLMQWHGARHVDGDAGIVTRHLICGARQHLDRERRGRAPTGRSSVGGHRRQHRRRRECDHDRQSRAHG
jgi:hypothetical protein